MKLHSRWTLAISFVLALSAHAATAPESLLGFDKGDVTSLFSAGMGVRSHLTNSRAGPLRSRA
jgi:hypothetical protein